MPGPPSDRVDLPADFTPTHQTGGLPGFPAVDVFGRPGALVRAMFSGRVTRISGHAVSVGGKPGGAYGRSVYIVNERAGRERFITHLDCLNVGVGDLVAPGEVIGTVADSAVSGKPGTSHAHLGMRKA